MMRHMPAIPESTRSSIILRLLDHAGKNWPQLAKVRARYHGSFAYITGVLRNGEQIPLFRLRYGGSAHTFGFAIYSAASDRYEDAVLLTGSPVGTPQEALDTACTVHLAGLGHEPPTNLRGRPLKPGARGHLFYRVRIHRGRKGERRSMSEADYARLITAAHQQLQAPVILIWDRLNTHISAVMRAFIQAHPGWLTEVRLPAYAPELNPAEGAWAAMKASLGNLAVRDVDQLAAVMKNRLKRIQYRPALIEAFLAQTGLTFEPQPP